MTGELESRKASLAFGERRLERAADLFARAAVSYDRKDESETEAQLARLELKRAVENRRIAKLELAR